MLIDFFGILMSKYDTLYIVGPTASGKTALSVALAKALGAEIVCADSQTIRRGMNIGTAKPTQKEMANIPHHLLDIIDPYEQYSLADYQKVAQDVVKDIHSRGKIALVVGGTGLYIDSLYYKYKLPHLARRLPATGRLLARLSVEELQQEIVDSGLEMPENRLNSRHLVNTILRSGEKGMRGEPSKTSIIVGINPERQILVDRIDRRVDLMFENGFVEEVKSLIATYGRPPEQFDAIGYRIVLRMLDGGITEIEAKELFKIADRQYAKRQLSWFKRNKNIVWFSSPEEAKTFILENI
jgi:tRNA dimethylallyltransferase